MIKLRTLFFCALVLAPQAAQAEMYKYVDEKGRVTYSNKPIKGGQKVDLPELSTVPAPKVDTSRLTKPGPGEQDKRRKELEEQIAQEEKALAAARQELAAAEESPDTGLAEASPTGQGGRAIPRAGEQVITKDGKKFVRRRAVARDEEQIKRLKETVELHEKNLARLKAELAALDKPAATSPTRSEEKK